MPLEAECRRLIEVVETAGRAVSELARTGFETHDKSGDDTRRFDPVTTADLEADRLLREGLLAAYPEDGWLSEEHDELIEPGPAGRIWIVDPIDGTREFVQGIPEYSLSAALVVEGTAVVAAVHNPVTGELYSARRGDGARLNGEPIRADHPLGPRPVMLASHSGKRRRWEPFSSRTDVRRVGSIAYRMALVAGGRADFTVSLRPKHPWDVAAGTLLVEEAGGQVTDKRGRPFRFDGPLELDGMIAATTASFEIAHELVTIARRPEPL